MLPRMPWAARLRTASDLLRRFASSTSTA
jgi:hypothetical protein